MPARTMLSCRVGRLTRERIEVGWHQARVSQVSQLKVEIQGIPHSIKTLRTGQIRSHEIQEELHSQAARTDLLGGYKPATSGYDPYNEQGEGTEVLNDGSCHITMQVC